MKNDNIEWEIHYKLKHYSDVERVYHKKYKRKGYAWRMAKQLFSRTNVYHYWLVGRPFKKSDDSNEIMERFCDML